MPSPAGHAIIGLALGSAWLLPRGSWREQAAAAWRQRGPLLGAMVLANAPDVDYVPGLLRGDFNAYHHFYTHTLGWCVLLATSLWCVTRSRGHGSLRTFGWLLALLLSHLVADYFSADHRPPLGLMAWWPLSERFIIAPHPLFWDLRKANLTDALQIHNVMAVLVELAWTLPLLALTLLAKRLLSPRSEA
jgi:hypothetical protein